MFDSITIEQAVEVIAGHVICDDVPVSRRPTDRRSTRYEAPLRRRRAAVPRGPRRRIEHRLAQTAETGQRDRISARIAARGDETCDLVIGGSSGHGIAWSDVDAKYRALMPHAPFNEAQIEASLALIHDFDRQTGVAALIDLLSPQST
jgi:hypothetical protein